MCRTEGDETRRARIVALLETRDDGLPTPWRSSRVPAGFDHRATVRVTCPDCLANDFRLRSRRGLSRGCETCGGVGYVEERRDRDPYARNDKPSYGSLERRDQALERDRQIDMLGRQTRPPVQVDEEADAADHPYRWERERVRMWRRYDYQWLDVELDALRDRDPDGCHALHAVYVYGWLQEVSAIVEEAVERGLRFLELRGRLYEALAGRPLRAPGFEQAKHPALVRRDRTRRVA